MFRVRNARARASSFHDALHSTGTPRSWSRAGWLRGGPSRARAADGCRRRRSASEREHQPGSCHVSGTVGDGGAPARHCGASSTRSLGLPQERLGIRAASRMALAYADRTADRCRAAERVSVKRRTRTLRSPRSHRVPRSRKLRAAPHADACASVSFGRTHRDRRRRCGAGLCTACGTSARVCAPSVARGRRARKRGENAGRVVVE